MPTVIEDRRQQVQRAVDIALTDVGSSPSFASPDEIKRGAPKYKHSYELGNVLTAAVRDWLGGGAKYEGEVISNNTVWSSAGSACTANRATPEEYRLLLEAVRKLLYKAADPDLSADERAKIKDDLRGLGCVTPDYKRTTMDDSWKPVALRIVGEGSSPATQAVQAVLPPSATALAPVMANVPATEREAGWLQWNNINELIYDTWGNAATAAYVSATKEVEEAKKNHDFNRLLNNLDRGLAYAGLDYAKRVDLRKEITEHHDKLPDVAHKLILYNRIVQRAQAAYIEVARRDYTTATLGALQGADTLISRMDDVGITAMQSLNLLVPYAGSAGAELYMGLRQAQDVTYKGAKQTVWIPGQVGDEDGKPKMVDVDIGKASPTLTGIAALEMSGYGDKVTNGDRFFGTINTGLNILSAKVPTRPGLSTAARIVGKDFALVAGSSYASDLLGGSEAKEAVDKLRATPAVEKQQAEMQNLKGELFPDPSRQTSGAGAGSSGSGNWLSLLFKAAPLLLCFTGTWGIFAGIGGAIAMHATGWGDELAKSFSSNPPGGDKNKQITSTKPLETGAGSLSSLGGLQPQSFASSREQPLSLS